MEASFPVFFVTDLLNPAIEKSSLYHQTFEKLSDTFSIQEVDERKVKVIQLKLIEYNHLINVQTQSPQEEMTCAFTNKGAYWLPFSALESAIETLRTALADVRSETKLPIWRLTSSEMITYHINNLRHLVLSLSNDAIVLSDLKKVVNGHHDSMARDLGELRKKVMNLIRALRELDSNRISITAKYFEQLERCRITRMMLNREDLTEEALGYTRADLRQAEKFLEDRCHNILPHFQEHQKNVYEMVLKDLLEGERIQFFHANQWAEFFDEIGEPPENHWGFSSLAFIEREGHNSFMATRLDELQACEYCRSLAHDIENQYAGIDGEPESRLVPDAGESDALSDQEIETLIISPPVVETVQENPISKSSKPEKEKPSHRKMAFLDRKR